MRRFQGRAVLGALLSVALVAPAAGVAADPAIVLPGDGLVVTVYRDPFHLEVARDDGTVLYSERLPALVPPDAPGARYAPFAFAVSAGGMLQFSSYTKRASAEAWFHATRVAEISGRSFVLDTNDPSGRRIALEIDFPASGEVQIGARLVGGIVDPEALGATAESLCPGQTAGCGARTILFGDAFASPKTEEFLGFGERYNSVAQRGNNVPLWSEEGSFGPGPGEPLASALPTAPGTEMLQAFPSGPLYTYYPVPFALSTRGYGLLLDTGAYGEFRLATDLPDAVAFAVEDDRFGLRIFDGPSPLDVIERFTAATGRPRVPPSWAFTPWISRTGGHDQAVTREQARRFRELDIPDGVIGIEPWGSAFSGVNRTGFPNLDTVIAELHAHGYKALAYLVPYVQEGSLHYQEGVDLGAFAKNASGEPYLFWYLGGTVAEIDFTNPAAAAFFRSMVKTIPALGFDGFMNDFGEYTPPDARFADGSTGREIHNRYPYLYDLEVTRAMREARGDDFVVFARAGWTGSAAQETVTWAGDQNTTWERLDGLASIVPASLSVGISGAPFHTSDIGGYHDFYNGGPGKELYLRWAEQAALSPVMRLHGGAPLNTEKNEPWHYDDETVAVYGRLARLHTSLFPYLEAAASDAVARGWPVMRALYLHYPRDPESLRQDEEYLLGRDLLVAPVLTPGATSWSAYLPPGKWIDFWTGTEHEGGGTVTVPAPLDRIPVFVRAGAILPRLDEHIETFLPDSDPATGTLGALGHVLRVTVYPNGESFSSRFRLADGTTLDYSLEPGRAAFSVWQDASGAVASGPRPGPFTTFSLELPVGFAPCSVTVNGAPMSDWERDGKTLRLSASMDAGEVVASAAC